MREIALAVHTGRIAEKDKSEYIRKSTEFGTKMHTVFTRCKAHLAECVSFQRYGRRNTE